MQAERGECHQQGGLVIQRLSVSSPLSEQTVQGSAHSPAPIWYAVWNSPHLWKFGLQCGSSCFSKNNPSPMLHTSMCKVSSSDASNSIPFALMPLKSLLSYWISKQDYWPPDDKRHTGGQRSGYGFMPPCYITAGEWLIVRYRSLAVCESVWMLLISIILKLKPLQSHDLLLLLPWWRGQPQCH